jgi:hypothetical protein
MLIIKNGASILSSFFKPQLFIPTSLPKQRQNNILNGKSIEMEMDQFQQANKKVQVYRLIREALSFKIRIFTRI